MAAAVRDLDIDELKVGDSVLVNPAGRVPADGTVLSGHSFLDQARIMGAAVLTYLITRDIRSTISVVTVASACGIAAGTPLGFI